MIAKVYYVNDKAPEGKRWTDTIHPSECYDHLCTRTVADGEDGLAEVFTRLNIGDHYGYNCRSMSVGDIVVGTMGGTTVAWVCAPVGWRMIEPPGLGPIAAAFHHPTTT